MLLADARTKLPGRAGYPARFPNPTVASKAIRTLVDARWEEYGIGDFLPSPSRLYERLRRGAGAAVE
jgi:4-hydroxy-3-polyprenylbenzoate decarboxylase